MTDTERKYKLIEIKIRQIKRRQLIRQLECELLKRKNRQRLDDDIEWITSNGARIPLKDGEPMNEVGEKIFSDSYSPEVHKLLSAEHKGVKGAAAIDKLIEEGGGHVKNAFNKKALGVLI